MTIVQARVTQATIHYLRTSDSNYAAWGLHLFGDGLAARRGHGRVDERDALRGQRRGRRREPQDPARRRHDSRRFIVHSGRRAATPTPRTPTPDRFFIPLATPDIWLKQGDGRIFTCKERGRLRRALGDDGLRDAGRRASVGGRGGARRGGRGVGGPHARARHGRAGRLAAVGARLPGRLAAGVRGHGFSPSRARPASPRDVRPAAGNYEYKVALNNSWDENYGAGGAPGGAKSRSPRRAGR